MNSRGIANNLSHDAHRSDDLGDNVHQYSQWSTGLGFDGLLQKACLVVGLSMPVDKPIAKCGNCDRELGESNISRLYVK